MRVLLVSDEFGRPENTGYRQRIANISRALASLRDDPDGLRWLILARMEAGDRGAPVDIDIVPHVVPVPYRRRRLAIAHWPFARLPWRLMAIDLRSLRRTHRRLLADQLPFDLVFLTQIDTWAALRPMLDRVLAPGGLVALDYNDVESAKQTGRRRAHRHEGGIVQRARNTALAIDAHRWARLEQQAAANTTSFVCSEVDRRRLGGRPEVLPNAVPAPPVGYRRHPAVQPTMLFVGSLTYEPNIDGLRLMIEEILPLVRDAVPTAVLRVVGHGYNERVVQLAACPGVELVGEVDSVAPELANATLSVVPLRFGGGTRIKILEAFAHEVPVVSTTVGAEGLDVRAGEDCVLADTPEAFAEACVRLLRDPIEAARLVANARALAATHDAARIRADFIATLRSVHAERRAAQTSR